MIISRDLVGYYQTAFGDIRMGSHVWNRAERLADFGRDRDQYLDDWARFQFVEKGVTPDKHPEANRGSWEKL